jgi:hypothetical protein
LRTHARQPLGSPLRKQVLQAAEKREKTRKRKKGPELETLPVIFPVFIKNAAFLTRNAAFLTWMKTGRKTPYRAGAGTARAVSLTKQHACGKMAV